MALNSTSTIKIVDLLCEGPIEGIVGKEKGVFVDETPIKTGNSHNFPVGDISYDFRPGGRTQGRLGQASGETSTITDVNTEIGSNYSEVLNVDNEVEKRDYGQGQLIRQVTDQEADFVQLLFTIPRLFSTAAEGLAKGQLFNGSIRVSVFIQDAGKSTNYKRVFRRTITGISTNNYQIQTPRLELKGKGPWNIKVEKENLKEDFFEVSFNDFTEIDKKISLQSGRGNQILWTSLTEGQYVKTQYPFCAVAGVDISTEQFESLPTRAYLIKGRPVSIPSNARVRDDGSLDFIGSFDGSSKTAWTTCPVCCWRDIVTNSRYGAGNFIASENLSWADLYPLVKYANQQVDTPRGKEARFACNTVIGSRAEAFNVLQDLASVFRGMMYWQANTIQVSADHGNLDGSDVLPVHLYNNSNVIDGAFNYSGTSLKTRSTSIKVRYNDPDNFYKSNFVCVENAELIEKYGYQTKEIIAFGSTSEYQAQRLGRWMLASEELDGETVQFVTGLSGAVVIPGQVFAVADEMRQGARIAGRVKSATTTAIVADQTISLPGGSSHKLTCILADGTLQTETISSVSGATINTSGFPSAPLAQSVWSISSSTVLEQKFRCLSVSDNGDGQYAVVGVEHNDSIYATADSAKTLEFEDVTLFNNRAGKPTNLKISSKEITAGKNIFTRVNIDWTRGTNGSTVGYEVKYKIGKGNYVSRETINANIEIDNLDPGRAIAVQVRAVGAGIGAKKSAWVTSNFTIPDPIVEPDVPEAVLLPPDPINVTAQATGEDGAIIRWAIPTTGQNENNFKAIIRHSSKTDGTGTWPNSTLLRQVKAVTNSVVLPLIEGEYLVKFENEDGQRSTNARSAVIDLPNPIPRLNISVRREDQDVPPFQGDKDGVFYDEEYDGLVLDGNSTLDDVVDFDLLDSFDFVGIRLAVGNYYFRDVLDLGGKFNVLFERTLTSRGLYPSDSVDGREETLDRWSDFDGTLADDTSTNLYFRISDQVTTDEELLLEDGDFFLLEDGTDKIQMESDLDFGPWIPMESGRFTGRQFQFRAELETFHLDQTPIVDELGFTMQLETRTESSDTIASGAGAKVVTFANAFYQTPSIGVSASNFASGDYYEVTSATRTGFTVTFKNSSDAAIDRNFQYQAVGYGTEQP
tara:strand:+ start:1146 stop:4574 length:3429 start_codon:yes stop_codon:yes gene_type:complete